MFDRSLRYAAWAVCLAVGAGCVGAQAQPAPDNGSVGIETVTVTAERREESIQDVPSSVSAYDQSAITALGMTNADDLVRLTPGLSNVTSDGLSGATNISIRGISSVVGTATTAVYIDDTPVQVRFLGAGESAGTSYPTLFDLDRVEVLRGPQGTLFGASSEGGTVRFITAAPSLTDFGGHARAELSANEKGALGYQVGVAGGGPIIDDVLGFRVSAYAQRDGGWTNLQPYPGTTITNRNDNDSNVQALSAAIAWKVTDDLTLTPSIFWQRQHRANMSSFWRSLSDPDDDQFNSGQLQIAPTTDQFALYSLKGQWDLGGATIFSNTSYLDHSLEGYRDYTFGITEVLTGDYTGPHQLTTSNFSNPQKQFTQELRIQSSDPDSRLTWVIGGFYQNIQQTAVQLAVMPHLDDLTTAIFGVPAIYVFGVNPLPGDVVYSGLDHSRDSQIAGFGQADFKVTPELTATVGLRVAHTKFSFRNAQDGPFNAGPTAGDGRSSETTTLPKFGLNYKPDEDLLFYATASKGFRPGGANVPVPSICGPDLADIGLTGSPDTYESDHVWSYELGSKGQAIGNRLVWDASAYYIDWQGIQSSIYLPTCGFHFIANLGSAVSKGFDVQVNAIVAEGLTLGAAAGYTDAYFTQTITTSAGPLVSKGDALATPPWHLSFTADYSFLPFADETEAYVHLDDQFTSSYTVGNPADALYDRASSGYGSANTFSARAGVRFDTWDLSLFSKNLFNSHPILSTNHTSGSSLFVDSTIPPRSFGVTATVKF
jgi:outer membrane receptor protein involved in Fe transport